MLRKLNRVGFSTLLAVVACLALLFAAQPAPAQSTSAGTVAVTVVDQAGGVVGGAQLQLQDISTNDIRNAVTQDKGNYNFVDLPIGTYKLTVSKDGFGTQVFDTVIVQAAQVTDMNVRLQVAAKGQKVEIIEAAAPLVDTTSNAVSTTIDMKQIEDLPLQNRDISSLAALVPGYNGTWNGLPAPAQSNNIDGVISSTSRMKFNGDTAPQVQARIENIQEMTIQTDQMDAGQGFGQSAMEVNFVTRRGSNSFHGRAYEDFRNSYLNAQSWVNDAVYYNSVLRAKALGNPIPTAVKPKLILNQFGGSLGGPIIKNKLFFFGTFAELKQPGTAEPTATVLSPAAQLGNYSYSDATSGVTHTVNVFKVIQDYASSCACWPTYNPGVDGIVNPQIGNMLTNAYKTESQGSLIPFGGIQGSNLSTLQWFSPAARTNYYPAARVDYNFSEAFRVNFAWEMTKNPPQIISYGYFPGFPTQTTLTTNTTGSLGFDWTLKPTLINSFRGGLLYNRTIGTNSAGYSNGPSVGFATWSGNVTPTSPDQFYLGTGQYYPLFSASDTTTWQHGAHSVNFGFNWYREFDHYYNPSGGIYGIGLGLDGSDPAFNAFFIGSADLPGVANSNGYVISDLQALYATLNGRINGVGTGGYAGNPVNLKTQQYSSTPGYSYNLHELQKAWGLFFQDSYRVRPNFTLNYSLRWDFTGDDHDVTGAYHGITSLADIYGPSGLGNLFKPGVLQGNPIGGTIAAQEHQYNSWNFSPQPEIGIAWAPQFSEGFLGKLTGGNNNTVVRAGFGLRNFIEPYQFFWDSAADFGAFFFQKVALSPSGSQTGAGFFQPGTLYLGSNMLTYGANNPFVTGPPTAGQYQFSVVPLTYLKSATEAQFAFQPGAPGLNGIDPHVKQPYTAEWNLGIQRALGSGNAIEISYHGNRSIHQWQNLNLNEVNIFENQFLGQFEQAQTNLALNNANAGAHPAYKNTFAYDPAVAGEAATPVFDAAFATETASNNEVVPGTSIPGDYANPTYVNRMKQGQAGSMANSLTFTSSGRYGTNFFCNLVGANFAPCTSVFGYTNPGAYPSNFFQVNPFYNGSGTGILQSVGYATYNALQVDFRQKQWHGMQFDANYTWSHNIGTTLQNDWTGAATDFLTLRNFNLAYQPTPFDYRHVVHVSGTYDLPFGKGKMLLSGSNLLDRVVGGWTVGTIFKYQTGAPFRLGGAGYRTFNQGADSGVVLNGITVSRLQNAIGVTPVHPYLDVPGAPPNVPQPHAYCGVARDGSGDARYADVCTYEDGISPALLNNPTGGMPSTNPWAFANISPGTLIPPIYLYGPHLWTDDMSVTKAVAIRENLRFSLQGEFINAFNHPTFGNPGSGVTSTNLGTVGGPGGTFGRQIELRANLEF